MTKKNDALVHSAFREYWRHTLDMAFVKDIHGVYVDASQPFAEMVGKSSPAELIGKTDFEIFEDRELARRYTDDDARLIANGVSIENYVEPITPKHGRPRYSLASKHILRNDAGEPIGILGFGHDISAEYQAKQNYETELNNLFELPPDALIAVLFDITDWRVVDVRCRDDKDQVISCYRKIDDYIQNAAARVKEDEAVSNYFASFSPSFLKAEYDRGRRRHSLEYLRSMIDGSERWVRDELHFLLDPVNGHLSLIVVLHDIDEEKREYVKLMQAAEQDAMTGLLNHDVTIKRIEEYISEATGMQALFMIDLDNFKQFNDCFGHQHGDSILAGVSEAIRNTFRTTDITGRLGGDEFMALMKDVCSEEAVRRRAAELLSALQFTSTDSGRTLELTTSIGIAMFQAEGSDFPTLYSEVDAALYRSKRDGKNRYTIYNRAMKSMRGEQPLPALESVSTVQLQTLLDYMDGGVVMAEISDDIHITYVSPSMYRSFGRDPVEAESLAEDVFSFVLPEDLPELRKALLETAGSDELLDHSYRVSYGGRTEWRRVRVKRIPEAGDGIHRIVAVVTDISDLRKANEHLLEAEERYRTAIEQTEALLWSVDIPTRTLTRTGPAWERFFSGISVFADMPESYIVAGSMHPNSIPRLRLMFENMYAGVDSDSYYFKLYTKDREEVWVKDRFKLLRDGNGQPYCALGITQLVPNINAEMRSFAQEQRFAETTRVSLAGYVCANFTKNVVEYAEMSGDSQYASFIGMPFDEYHQTVVARFVEREDAPRFSRSTAREYLLERFREGENWRFIDYRRIGEDGACRWISLFIKLMRHPISGDVYAFCYLRDNETCRNWELTYGKPLSRNATLLLYSRESMDALSRHVLSTIPGGNLVAISVIEMIGLDRIRDEMGDQEARELLFTFGRLCRIAIGGDIIIGQLDENRVALLRADAKSNETQRERVSDTMRLLKELLRQAHPEANVSLIGGFAVDRADRTSYSRLLKKADIALRSAAQTLSESAVAYVDNGVPDADEGGVHDLAERYRALEQRYQQQASMLRVSENDEMTGILGKSAFYRRVREVLDTTPSKKLAIVRFDINRFKVYNDVRGTAAGDKLLRDIAGRMRKGSSEALVYARLESDHFVLLTPDDSDAIGRSEEKLAEWLAGYASDFRLSATVGVYRIDDPTIDVSLMCDRALLALRSVKSGFETKLGYYNYTLRYRLIDEQQLVDDMEVALRTDQFLLYFQPQVNYETGALVGAEAFVRWNHPARGLLPPSVFIPLFEKNGLITRLDEYVWDRCCQHIQNWITRYPQAQNLSLSVSVNVSRLDIYDEKLATTLLGMVEKYSLPPSALRLEITESAYMENPQQLIDMVRELQHAGFVVEMDDFGSGYSSLNTLKDVTVDVLKLDMRFLESSTDSARGGNILSSVIRMAHWLKLPIIVEGVETKVQADYLKSLGCTYMQGYFFEKPLPAARFETLLSNGASSLVDKYKSTSVEGMAAFWDPSAQQTLLFNSFVGGAAIMEYRNGLLEVLRVNDNYYKTLGTTREEYLPTQNNLLNRFDAKNEARLREKIDEAILTGEECDCELEGLHGVGGVTRTWMHNRIRLLAKNGDSAILYFSIEDITDRKLLEREREVESERTRLLMQNTGIAFFDYDYASDALRYQLHIPERGLERRVVTECSRREFTSPLLHPESAAAMRNIIQWAKVSHVDGEIEFYADLTRKGMRWWRMRYSSVEDSDGRVYRMVGQAEDIQDSKDRASISESIRRRLNADTKTYAFNDEVVDQIFGLFYGSSDIAGAIETTLSLLGEYYDLSRAYIFEDVDAHTAAKNTFEWCASGVRPERSRLQHVSYDDMGGRAEYIGQFDLSGVNYCPDVRELTPSARAILEPQGICSMLHYAIRDNGVFTGFIGFDECRTFRIWTDEQVGTLRFVSRIIASYLLRLRQYDSAAFSTDFRAALDDNAEFIYIIDPDTYSIIYSNRAIQRHAGADCVGKICYEEFIGRSEPCKECPVRSMRDKDRLRLVEVTRADGMILLSHASPLRWNGRNMAMVSCVDITDRLKQQEK